MAGKISKNLKSTKDIVEILSKVANDVLNKEANYEEAHCLLRVSKYAIQVYALLNGKELFLTREENIGAAIREMDR